MVKAQWRASLKSLTPVAAILFFLLFPALTYAATIQKGYVSGMFVSVFDLQTNTLLKQIDMLGSFAAGIAVNPKTNKVYVTSVLANMVLVVDANTDTVIQVVPVGLSPVGVAVNPVTNRIYVANSRGNSVSVIDGATDTPIGLPIAVAAGSDHLAVDTVRNAIYVTSTSSNTVSIIDGATYNVSSIAVSQPADVAVDSASGQAYAIGNSGVTVIDTGSQAAKASFALPVGLSPERVFVDALTHRVYVYGPNKITPLWNTMLVTIDGQTNALANTLQLNTGYSNLALDTVTNRLYLNRLTTAMQAILFGPTLITGTHAITVADTPTASTAALNVLARINFVWYANLGFNVYLANGDMAILDNGAPTAAPPPVAPPPPPPVKPLGINVTPTDVTVYLHHFDPKMKEQQFAAKDTNGVDVTKLAAWEARPASLAAVVAGLATGLKPGEASITATLGGKSGSANLQVMCRQYQYWPQSWMPYSDQFLGFTTMGNTIGKAGCALTSTAMLLSGMNIIYDPGQLNTLYKNLTPINTKYSKVDGKWHTTNPGFNEALIIWDATFYIAGQNVTYKKKLSTFDPTNYTTPLAISSLDSLLDQCYAVIVGIRTSTTDPTHHHYVLVVGREGTKHLINDPGWEKKYLEDFNNGNIYSMHVYSFIN